MADSEQYDSGQDEAVEEALPVPRGPERALFWWFCGIVVLDVASVFWLALRAESPTYLRGILDFLMYAATGAGLAYFSFRALFLYPFRTLDLLAIVITLSLGVGATNEILRRLSGIGLIRSPGEDEAYALAELVQWCLIVTSVLIAGAALGLRHCTLLRMERPSARVLCIVAGMLVLPAASGTAAFMAPVFLELQEAPEYALAWLLAWFVAVFITSLNTILFIKTLTLREEIQAKEKMP